MLVGIPLVAAAAILAGLALANVIPNGKPQPSPSPSARPSPEPTSTSSATQSLATLPSLSPALGCLNGTPDASALSQQSDPAACFGRAPITFDASWSSAGAVDCGPTVEPAWLSCPDDGSLMSLLDVVPRPILLFALPPEYDGYRAVGSRGLAVRVTGHFDDPVAQTCREVETIPGESPRLASSVVESCRRVFVVTQAVPLQP